MKNLWIVQMITTLNAYILHNVFRILQPDVEVIKSLLETSSSDLDLQEIRFSRI